MKLTQSKTTINAQHRPPITRFFLLRFLSSTVRAPTYDESLATYLWSLSRAPVPPPPPPPLLLPAVLTPRLKGLFWDHVPRESEGEGAGHQSALRVCLGKRGKRKLTVAGEI